ncbi:hypothetical protein D1871_09860 [Nakamurella silvestris]|nr:hypothetical protein D1871_09860 [Nakamurella silvestris]
MMTVAPSTAGWHPVGPRRTVRALLTVVLAAVIAMLSAAPAWAHATLLSTDPGQGSVLQAAPATVSLTFSEPIGPAAETFELYGPDGFRAAVPARGLDAVVTALLPEGLAQGTFQLDWRVISVDSHPLAGTLTFSVGAATVLPDRTAAPGDDPAVALAFRIAQFLAYLGLITVIGLTLFGVLVDRRAGAAGSAGPAGGRRHFGRLSALAGIVAVLGHLLLVPLTYLRQQGLTLGVLAEPGRWGSEFGTDQGFALALVLVGISLILWATVRLSAGRGSAASARVLALIGVAVAAVSVAVVGHTRGPKSDPVMVASDLVHVIAASVWFGGLIALIVTLRRAARRGDDAVRTAGLVARFSVLAGWTVAALGVSGVVMAWTVLDNWAALVDTGYGQSLLVKVALVVGAVLIAWWNRARLVPAISRVAGAVVPEGPLGGAADLDTAAVADGSADPDPGSVLTAAPATAPAWRRLRVLLLAEVGVLVLVVAVTSLLVSLSPVADTAPPAAAGPAVPAEPVPEFFEFDAPLGAGSVTGRLGPVSVGLNTLRFTLRDSTGAAVDPVALPKMELAPAAGGDQVLVQPRYADVVGEFAADVRVPAVGMWTLRIDVTMADGTSSATVDFTVD